MDYFDAQSWLEQHHQGVTSAALIDRMHRPPAATGASGAVRRRSDFEYALHLSQYEPKKQGSSSFVSRDATNSEEDSANSNHARISPPLEKTTAPDSLLSHHQQHLMMLMMLEHSMQKKRNSSVSPADSSSTKGTTMHSAFQDRPPFPTTATPPPQVKNMTPPQPNVQTRPGESAPSEPANKKRKAIIMSKAILLSKAKTHGLPSSSSQPKKLTAIRPPLAKLSAYNFYFRNERDRIVYNTDDQPHDVSHEQKQRLLESHWNRDRNVRRKHRRTHGKVSFTGLAAIIANRWKELTPDIRNFYQEVADMDAKRFKRETREYENFIACILEKQEEKQSED